MSNLKLTWAIVKTSNNGVITLKDKEVFGEKELGYSKRTREKTICFCGNAKEKVQAAQGKLSKEMQVLFITDKQFGMMQTKPGTPNWFEAALEVATTKQKSEIIKIK